MLSVIHLYCHSHNQKHPLSSCHFKCCPRKFVTVQFNLHYNSNASIIPLFRTYLLQIFSLLWLLCWINMLIFPWMPLWACVNISAVKYTSVFSRQCFNMLCETQRPVDFTIGTCSTCRGCLPAPQTCIGFKGKRLGSEMSAPHVTGSVFCRENPTANEHMTFCLYIALWVSPMSDVLCMILHDGVWPISSGICE